MGTVEEHTYLRQVYKQQLERNALGSSAHEKRLFKAVAGEDKGELFGYANLLSYVQGGVLNGVMARFKQSRRERRKLKLALTDTDAGRRGGGGGGGRARPRR